MVPATKWLWLSLVGMTLGVLAFRIWARKRRLRVVEFAGNGVEEVDGAWRVEFVVPHTRKGDSQRVRVEWLDAAEQSWLEWEEQLPPGLHTRFIAPKGTPGRCVIRLTAPGVRAERFVQWGEETPSHALRHRDAQ